MTAQRISVLILAHEQPKYVDACARSIIAHSGSPLQIVLVDNGSGPEVAEVFDRLQTEAATAGHEIARLRFEENIGAIRGRNEGMALVSGEFVAWIDSDCLVRTGGWAIRLAEYLRVNEDVGIVGPKLVYPWAPHDIQCAGCDVTQSGRVVFRGRGSAIDDDEHAAPRDCPTLISACWLMRTDLWRELGPLDDIFSPVQFEDIDYCYRARDAGKRVVYNPAVEMYHFEGMTTTRTPGLQYNSLTARNGVKFKRKWHETIAREGGIEDRQVKWIADVGWRPITEVDEPVVV